MPDTRKSGQWVRLVKLGSLFAQGVPAGELVEYRFDPEVTREDACEWAYRRLRRDMPSEDTTFWKVVEG